MLSNFLNRYPQIVSVIEHSEINTPFLNEIRLRVVDQDAWISCLKRLTKAFPTVIFSRRYQTVGTKFGFNWSVVVPGPRDKNDLQAFCDEADVVVSSLSEGSSDKAQLENIPVSSEFYKETRPIKDKKGNIVGEERVFRLPGVEEEYRSDFKGNTPRVFSAIQGGGEEMEHLKELFRRK